MEHRPCVVPRVTLGEVTTPLERAERLTELTILLASLHEVVLWIEEVAIVHGMAGVRLQFLFLLAQQLTDLQDAPVVVGILQRAGSTLVDLHIARHIAQAVVVVEAATTC